MDKQIGNIVFTKNRPLQLEGYLQSLYKHFPAELIQTYILYKQELFEEEYEQLFTRYSDCMVIKENNFSEDLFKILDQVEAKYILFGIDDVVYFDSVDFEVIDRAFESCADDIFGFSLRFGQDVLENGRDKINEAGITGQKIFKVNWQNGQTPNTRYPFELCATVYRTALVKQITASSRNNNPIIKSLFSPGSILIKNLGKVISTRPILKSFGYFYSPNTLESWNCRWCQNHPAELPSQLYFQKLCASAIQVNMVNATDRKVFDGSADFTVEALAQKYKQGYRLDIGFVTNNKPASTHCGREKFKLIESNNKKRPDKIID